MASQSQTLARGLRVLSLILGTPQGLTTTELSRMTGLDRAIVHRLVTTLFEEEYVARLDNRRYVSGRMLNELAGVERSVVITYAQPLLQSLADEGRGSAVLYFADGDDVLAVAAATPVTVDVFLSYRVGQRQPGDRGAAAYASTATRPPAPGEAAKIAEVRRLGWASSSGEVVPGAEGRAVPVDLGPNSPGASILFACHSRVLADRIVPQLLAAGRSISTFARVSRS